MRSKSIVVTHILEGRLASAAFRRRGQVVKATIAYERERGLILLEELRGLAGAWTVALIVGLFSTGSVVLAHDIVTSRAKAVALAYDAGSRTLLKAYPRALYRSRNEGRDWEPIVLPPAVARGRIDAVSIAAKGEAIYIAGQGFGVLSSPDGGRTWAAKNAGLPSKDVIAMSAHADLPGTLYVSLAGRKLFRSEDAGSHWRLMDAGPREQVLQLVHSNMAGSMQTGWFFAATSKGISRSMDCFCGWRDAGGLGQRVTSVAYDPHDPKRVYAAAEEALFVSADGGEQWARVQTPGRAVTALVVTPAGLLYAAVDDGELFASADHGSTWRHVDG
jgi:photosystem II stability/assembly factor-like uncharacterized protein